MKRTLLLPLLAVCASLLLGSRAVAQSEAQKPLQTEPPAANAISSPSGTEIGNGIFEQKCVSCHGHPATGSRAPSFATMKLMAPEKIYAALATGLMAPVVGHTMTDMEKRRVAETVSGRLIGSTGTGDAKAMPNHCESNPPLSDPAAGPAWNGWGADAGNTRFQSAKAAGLSADQLPRLKLKWAFGFPTGLSAYGQPTIVSGRQYGFAEGAAGEAVATTWACRSAACVSVATRVAIDVFCGAGV